MSNNSNGSGNALEQASRSSGTVTETDSASAKLKQTAEKPDSMKPSMKDGTNSSPANNANAKTMQDNG